MSALCIQISIDLFLLVCIVFVSD